MTQVNVCSENVCSELMQPRYDEHNNQTEAKHRV